MSEFKRYKRIDEAELRPVTEEDVKLGKKITKGSDNLPAISVSKFDLENGSPKIGDMIARNPEDHSDQWLVAEKYFKKNFAPVEENKGAKKTKSIKEFKNS